MHVQLTEQDRQTAALVEAGSQITVLNPEANTYKTLVSSILFQFADSQMAGAAGYATCINIAPTVDDRLDLAKITYEKTSMAKRVYLLLRDGFEINISKYAGLHSWEMRINRHTQLGYRRASSDKRLNALLYPLQTWADITTFTYLMAHMACLQLRDFATCSFLPWAELASEFLPIEEGHAATGKAMLQQLGTETGEHAAAQVSLDYWYPRVVQSFGPPSGEGNRLYRMFGLKHKTNEDLLSEWRQAVAATCESFGFTVYGANHENASTCD